MHSSKAEDLVTSDVPHLWWLQARKKVSVHGMRLCSDLLAVCLLQALMFGSNPLNEIPQNRGRVFLCMAWNYHIPIVSCLCSSRHWRSRERRLLCSDCQLFAYFERNSPNEFLQNRGRRVCIHSMRIVPIVSCSCSSRHLSSRERSY